MECKSTKYDYFSAPSFNKNNALSVNWIQSIFAG